ncbi:MAG: hypothetical protein LBU32_32285 [Clostridiales bacterium]|jgi:bifunctional pyridoxal-dependent enzyme with beta-cystathionase and maltose regulon repressor activities|nr:hypothetical protein [Clostridiales bacterium]
MPEDVIPMFVADTDSGTAPAALNAVRRRLGGIPVYAYTKGSPKLFDTIAAWFKRVYGLSVPPGWIEEALNNVGDRTGRSLQS